MKQFVLFPPSQVMEVYAEMKPMSTWTYNEKKKILFYHSKMWGLIENELVHPTFTGSLQNSLPYLELPKSTFFGKS